MESIFGLLISSLFYTVVYQLLAPLFSKREVRFITDSLGQKLLFGLLMSLGTSLILGMSLLLLAVPLVFVLSSTAILGGGLGAVVFFIGMVVLGIYMLQIPNWLMTVLLGKMMESTISVPSTGAAWKAAWAATLAALLPYLAFLFLYGTILLTMLVQLNVH